jgi:hypothetical protein
MKIKLNSMLIIAAVYWIINGLLGLVGPLSFFRVELTASTPMFLVAAMRFWGVANLALGVIAWLARNAEESQARTAIVNGFLFFFVLQALVSFYSYTFDPVPPHIVFGVIEALIGVGFFLARRSSS